MNPRSGATKVLLTAVLRSRVRRQKDAAVRHTVVATTLILFCLSPVPVRAKSIGVGDVEFGPSVFSGLNNFFINNFTGSSGLPPDFPVADNLTFNGAVLKLTQSDGTVDVVNLGNVGPGPLLDPISGLPPSSLLFPDTTSFTKADFTATLSQSDLLLSDGTTFLADPNISLTLTPSSGSALVPGIDLGAVTATPVPEPATLTLLGTGLAGILGARWRRRKRQD